MPEFIPPPIADAARELAIRTRQKLPNVKFTEAYLIQHKDDPQLWLVGLALQPGHRCVDETEQRVAMDIAADLFFNRPTGWEGTYALRPVFISTKAADVSRQRGDYRIL